MDKIIIINTTKYMAQKQTQVNIKMLVYNNDKSVDKGGTVD